MSYFQVVFQRFQDYIFPNPFKKFSFNLTFHVLLAINTSIISYIEKPVNVKLTGFLLFGFI